MIDVFTRFNRNDDGDYIIYKLFGSSKAEYNQVRREVNLKIKSNQDQTFLIVYVLAGHGCVKDGKQMLLLTEENDERF